MSQSKGLPVEPFVGYLERLGGSRAKQYADRDRAALAALRRALGKPVGDAGEAHRFVAPWLPEGTRPWAERCFYLVGSLFALYPEGVTLREEEAEGQEPGGRSRRFDLGASFASVVAKDPERGASVERRFTALLASHRDDLDTHLRHAVSLLRAAEAPVDFAQLLKDILGWNNPDRPVQLRWAQSFWRATQAAQFEAAARAEAGEAAAAANA